MPMIVVLPLNMIFSIYILIILSSVGFRESKLRILIERAQGSLMITANPGVTVPEMECPLKTEDIETLRLAIDPLSHSNSFGRDIYLTTLAHALYLLHHH